MVKLKELVFAPTPRADLNTEPVKDCIERLGWKGMNGLSGSDPIRIVDGVLYNGQRRVQALIELGYETFPNS